MQKSESIKELGTALAKAQAQVKPALKSETNPFHKSRYADFGDVLDACEDALTGNGLAIIQAPLVMEGGAGVETLLIHTSGQWISEVLLLPMTKRDAQGAGSCITYARRYALEGFMRIKREDDDGNAASGRAAAPAPVQAPAPPPDLTMEEMQRRAKEVQDWVDWLELKPDIQAVNETMHDLKGAVPVVQNQVWKLISGYAKEKRWAFDKATTAFKPIPQQQRA